MKVCLITTGIFCQREKDCELNIIQQNEKSTQRCVIVVLLYVFNWIFVFLVATNCSFVALWNDFLYMCKGMMFPLLPVSTLYGSIILTLFDNVFRFVVITECLLLKLIEFIFTMPIWSSSCLGLVSAVHCGLLCLSCFCRPLLYGWSCHTLCTS